MLQRWLSLLGLSLALALLAPAAGAQTVSQIRLMLHPYAAAPGDLPADVLARLQTLAGTTLSISSATRTGALEFTLASPIGEADAKTMLRRLRDDRSVLWAEPIRPGVALKSRTASSVIGNKLMVRLVGDPTPDWDTLLPRWSALTGASMSVQRQVGTNIWVLSVPPASEDTLAQMAEQLEADAEVQYADAVTRVQAFLVPNDPYYPNQWALSDPVGGVNAPAAWDLQLGSANVTVAVLDTGSTQHPDLAGRFLPGYNFISDPAMANNGIGRSPDASDPGDGTKDNECGDGVPGEPSSFHGTFVSGIIAANTNNGVGISGLDWNAKILPVRVLGKCGGTFDDIADAILWASGLPVAGVPPNPFPARVINLSLGGEISCPQALQDAINSALTQGTVIVVAAGNSATDVSGFAPASCGGVISVGASTRQGDRASYSNLGRRVDVSAPGGDGVVQDWILSTGNDSSGPGNPIYEYAIGTSAAAPHVAAAASLMIARNANLTPGRVQDIITGTTRNFIPGATCATSPLCGSGTLDISLALQSTLPGGGMAPPGTVPVIEYYNPARDHYFLSANAAEQAYVDTVLAGIFQRTGELFYAWADPVLAPLAAHPVCRFFAGGQIASHYFTAIASECQFIIAHEGATWLLENPAAFYVLLPDASGTCQSGTLPVYKFFDNRVDANQRHTIDLSVRRAMINRAWVPQGIGPNHVAFCTPI
ncbi:MAG TPA: S8 family peptidase [Casimicrobiaceae bacterium]|nr:S8 family peptidase [Casimicrobiaceae bacterium]